MALDPMQPVNVVRTADDVSELWRWLSAEPWVAADTETTGTSVFDPAFRVRLVQLGSRDDAWVIELDRWRGLVDDVFRRYRGQLVFHNASFDVKALAREGVTVPWDRVDDTMIALRLAEPTEPAGLKAACDTYVSTASSDGQKALADAMRKQKWDWSTVPTDFPPYLFYSALDTILTARLWTTDVARRGAASPVYPLEMQTRAVCSRMEQNGMRVSREACESWSRKLDEEAAETKRVVEEEYGFPVTSTQELSHWLVSDSEARPYLTKETASGRVSVDKEVLEQVAYYCSGPAKVVAECALFVRKLDKVNGSYFRNFLAMSDRQGLLHPQIETIAARTGRMSIREPGLQTLPKRSPDSTYKAVRQAVIPYEPGHRVLTCDFNQIELRLVSGLSHDPGLIAAFREADEAGSDFFTEAARGLYSEPDFKKSDSRRGVVKSFFYASAYGAGVEKMAITAGLPVSEIREVKDQMAIQYPGFFRYAIECQAQAQENGFWVETAYGRKLRVDEGRVYSATNTIVQGTAADVMKQALVNMAQAGLEPMMSIPVHDEVVMSVPQQDLVEVAHVVEQSMACDDFDVPLTTDSQTGDTWGDCA